MDADLCTELANFVHGALCPYFIAVGYDAYANCENPATTTCSSFTHQPTGNYSATVTGNATTTGVAKSTVTAAQFTGAASINKLAGAMVFGGVAAVAFFM